MNDVGTVATRLTVTTGLVAGVVHVGFAGETRRLLGFPFSGLPAHPSTALTIFAGNARILVCVVAAAVIVQSPWCAGRSSRGVVVVSLLDTVVVLQTALNVLLIGAAVGAYGPRMIAAMLPHGPAELMAFSLALSLYVRSRHQAVSGAAIVWNGVAGLSLLLAAALLETYVVL